MSACATEAPTGTADIESTQGQGDDALRGEAFVGNYESVWLMPGDFEERHGEAALANRYVRERIEIRADHTVTFWRANAATEAAVNAVDIAHTAPFRKATWRAPWFKKGKIVLNGPGIGAALYLSSDADGFTVSDNGLQSAYFDEEEGSWALAWDEHTSVCTLTCKRVP